MQFFQKTRTQIRKKRQNLATSIVHSSLYVWVGVNFTLNKRGGVMSCLDLLNAMSLPYPVSWEIISIPTFSSLLLGHSDLLQSGSEHFACLFLPHPDSLFSSPSAAFCIQKKVLSLICVHTCRPMHNFFYFKCLCIFLLVLRYSWSWR